MSEPEAQSKDLQLDSDWHTMWNLYYCFPGPRIKSSPSKHFIRDTNQQILVLEGSTLVAVPDKRCKRGGDP